MSKKQNKVAKRLFGIVLSIILMSGISFSVHNEFIKDKDASNNEEMAFIKEGELMFLRAISGDTLKVIDIEVADNEHKRSQGLMYRSSMPEYFGMLFIFDNEEPLTFWMKDTYIPLDILFVNDSLEIVSISENCKPMVKWPIKSEKPAKYVVEVNAGYVYQWGVKAGDKIQFLRLQ